MEQWTVSSPWQTKWAVEANNFESSITSAWEIVLKNLLCNKRDFENGPGFLSVQKTENKIQV